MASGVEGLADVEQTDQELPIRRAILRVALADGEIGAQDLAVVRQRHLELRRDRLPVHAGIALRGEAPAEHSAREDLEIVDHRLWLMLGPEGPLLDAFREQPLTVGVTTVEDRAGADQRRSGDDEPGRLHEAEPLEVCRMLGSWRAFMASVRVRP